MNNRYINKKITDLIQLREEFVEKAKTFETKEGFITWQLTIVEDPMESYPDLCCCEIYEELSNLTAAMGRKIFNLRLFTEDEYNCRKNRDACFQVLTMIKKKPGITREEISEKDPPRTEEALDYLIETGSIEYRNVQKAGFWKILNDRVLISDLCEKI